MVFGDTLHIHFLLCLTFVLLEGVKLAHHCVFLASLLLLLSLLALLLLLLFILLTLTLLLLLLLVFLLVVLSLALLVLFLLLLLLLLVLAATAAVPVRFRHLLEDNGLAEAMFSRLNELLEEKGLMMRGGTIVDATIIAAPSSTKN